MDDKPPDKPGNANAPVSGRGGCGERDDVEKHIQAEDQRKIEVFRHLRKWLETGSDFHRAAAIAGADQLGDESVRIEVAAHSKGGPR